MKTDSQKIKTLFVLTLILLGSASFLKETLFKTNSVLAAVDFKQGVETSEVAIPLQTLGLSSVAPEVSKTDRFKVKVPVLMYHYIKDGVTADNKSYVLTVTPSQLDQQLNWLVSNGYQTVSLNDLYNSLEESTPLPPKSVVLTFDDGYRDFYQNAFPLLKKHNVRAVSFYVVDYTTYPGYMNWDMLREIHNSGLVDVESHTLYHPQLSRIRVEEARQEVFSSKKILEKELHKKVNFFAYPYGDTNPLVTGLVKEAGYKLAFSAKFTDNSISRGEKYFISRLAITGTDTIDSFKSKLEAN